MSNSSNKICQNQQKIIGNIGKNILPSSGSLSQTLNFRLCKSNQLLIPNYGNHSSRHFDPQNAKDNNISPKKINIKMLSKKISKEIPQKSSKGKVNSLNSPQKAIPINLSNLKLCQKILLPEGRNFFVTEENFVKIKDAITEKDLEISFLEEEINKLKDEKFGENVMEELRQVDEYIQLLERKNESMLELIKFIFDFFPFNKNIWIKIKELGLDDIVKYEENCNNEYYLKKNNEYNIEKYNLHYLLEKRQKPKINYDIYNENFYIKNSVSYREIINRINIDNNKFQLNEKNTKITLNEKIQEIEKLKEKLNDIYIKSKKFDNINLSIYKHSFYCIKNKTTVLEVDRFNFDLLSNGNNIINSNERTNRFSFGFKNSIYIIERNDFGIISNKIIYVLDNDNSDSYNNNKRYIEEKKDINNESFKISDKLNNYSREDKNCISMKESINKKEKNENLKVNTINKKFIYIPKKKNLQANDILTQEYMNDMFMILYNQAKSIEEILNNKNVKKEDK